MSSLNIKQGSDAHFPEYPLASPSSNEIDLLNLIDVLWRAKKTIMYSAAIFLIPICISFDTAEKRRYATYLILNRRFSFEF